MQLFSGTQEEGREEGGGGAGQTKHLISHQSRCTGAHIIQKWYHYDFAKAPTNLEAVEAVNPVSTFSKTANALTTTLLVRSSAENPMCYRYLYHILER